MHRLKTILSGISSRENGRNKKKRNGSGIKNALFILDEIDTGNKEGQKLHILLKEQGIMDIKYIKENNIRFVFVSATMKRELHELYKWGDIHEIHYMTVPKNYISHQDFLDMNIIQEFYPIDTEESAKRWITEDILDRYGDDYRVHIIRSNEQYKPCIINACNSLGILYKNHCCNDRISHEDLTKIFDGVKNHIVLIVKGFYRRANLIPNAWKMKIGATHEKYVKRYDTNVQIQGLPGRMTGYWKDEILGGHITGPHRTSISAIMEYEEFYKNPYGKYKYKMTKTKNIFMNDKFIDNFDIVERCKKKE